MVYHGFKTSKPLFLVAKRGFWYKNINYSQLPASNLKLSHESRVNMQNKPSQKWRQIGTKDLMAKNKLKRACLAIL